MVKKTATGTGILLLNKWTELWIKLMFFYLIICFKKGRKIHKEVEELGGVRNINTDGWKLNDTILSVGIVFFFLHTAICIECITTCIYTLR